MKAFERWLRKYEQGCRRYKGRPHLVGYGKFWDITTDDEVEEVIKDAWKAALKWVLKHDPDIGLASCIRKELEKR